MKLERLEIQGFKSFKDRTVIYFDEGITGIVGPNGCGKSNVVDALFWVMGEQSAKHLRGTRMSDLIFSGSDKYNPGSFAEVTLVLNNEEQKHIHIFNKVLQPQEIQLTRKLYRNGETEYRINGMPARLRDIQEVFLDTGAGAKSYSIIAQGEVDRLVKSKPEEKRVMIEEVAGITKFKIRKKESLRKIQQTETNLERIKDLKKEIYKTLKNLEKQAEKAAKAKSLKNKVKSLQFTIDGNKEFDLLDNLRKAKSTIQENEIESQNMMNEKSKLELEIESDKNVKDLEEKKLEIVQVEFNEASKDLAAGEEKLHSLEKEVQTKENLINSKKNEIEEFKQEIASLEEKLQESKSKLDEFGDKKYTPKAIAELKDDLEEKKVKLDEVNEELNDKRKQKSDLSDQMNSNENELYRIQCRLDELSENFSEINDEIDQIEQQSSMFSDEVEEKRNKYRELEASKESDDKKFNELSDKKTKQEKELAELKEEVEQVSRLVFEKHTFVKNTENLIKSFEENDSGNLEFVEKAEKSFKIISDLIHIKDDSHSMAIEKLIGHIASDILIEDQTDFNTLNEKSKTLEGSLSGIFTTKQNMPYDLENHLNDLLKLSDLVEIKDGNCQKTLERILAGYYIINNDQAPNLELIQEGEFKALTNLAGEFLVQKIGTELKTEINFGAVAEEAVGVIKYKSDLEKTKKELTKLESKLKELESQKENQVQLMNDLVLELDEHEKLVRSNQEQAMILKTQLKSHEDHLEAGNARLNILKNKKDNMSAQRVDLIEKEDECQDKTQAITEEMNKCSDEIYEIEQSYLLDKDSYDQTSTEYLEIKAYVENFDKNKENLEQLIYDRTSRIEALRAKEERNSEYVTEESEEIEKVKAQFSERKEENLRLSTSLVEIEKKLKAAKKEYQEKVELIQKHEKRIQKLDDKIRKIEKNSYENEVKITKYIEDEELLVRNFFEMYQVNLRKKLIAYMELDQQVTEGLLEFDDHIPAGEVPEDFEFERKIPSYLRDAKERFSRYKKEFNRLGEINWQAVHDYERQKARYDFLKDQEEELNKSIEDLMSAIHHIDEKSRKRFKEAFTIVNDKFTKVFPIIFGGGSAKLQLVGKIEDPECGINIIAQPPGKKMQSINLMSGGEKALIAVSLIFSIFLVKPSPFCLLDEVDAPLDDANVGRFNELLREMSSESQFILITHNKKTMELNDVLYGITMQEAGVSKAVSIQLH